MGEPHTYDVTVSLHEEEDLFEFEIDSEGFSFTFTQTEDNIDDMILRLEQIKQHIEDKRSDQ